MRRVSPFLAEAKRVVVRASRFPGPQNLAASVGTGYSAEVGAVDRGCSGWG